MNVQNLIKERRMTKALISPSDLVEFFQPQHEGHIRIPEFVGIPKDAVCTKVEYLHSLDTFAFTFYHEEFESVPHGQSVRLQYTEYRIVEFLMGDRNETTPS